MTFKYPLLPLVFLAYCKSHILDIFEGFPATKLLFFGLPDSRRLESFESLDMNASDKVFSNGNLLYISMFL